MDINIHPCSVVKIKAKGLMYDYNDPWKSPDDMSWTGSGFVISGRRILTNSHVASGTIHQNVQLHFSDDVTYYKARVLFESNDCDLAMLTVDDDEFWARAQPVEMGDMPKLHDKIMAVGFSAEGDTVCYTPGSVSRMESRNYCTSGAELLDIQISAQVNPGNSGGPVFDSNGKLMGVVHQKSFGGEGLGFAIPNTIVKHFLHDCELGIKPQFPALQFAVQNLQNKHLRLANNLRPEQSGVRVTAIAPISAVHNRLKVNDVLLKIDDCIIQNDCTVKVDYCNKLSLDAFICNKFIGDTVTFTVWRDQKEVTVEVPLTQGFNQINLIPSYPDNKPPQYFIKSGLAIQPLTENCIDDDMIHLLELAKKRPDHEVVILNKILESDDTLHLEDYQCCIIKKINGHKISNFKEAVAALMQNQEQYHRIVFDNKDEISVLNLSHKEDKHLLKAYHIKRPYSYDIKPLIKSGAMKELTFSKELSSDSDSSSSCDEALAEPASKKQRI